MSDKSGISLQFIFTQSEKVDESASSYAAVACLTSNDLMPRNGDQYFPYRQNSNLYYLTGIEQENTMLILCPFTSRSTNERNPLYFYVPTKPLKYGKDEN
jgi:Xaa-Pro aminopeptidase